jgi:hypothetical protein
MSATTANEDDAHPELSSAHGPVASPDELTFVPCGPDCALPLAADLWRAWRLLPLWEARVDVELPGDFARLLPTLVLMPTPRPGERHEPPPLCADPDPPDDGISVCPADEIPEAFIDALRDGVYRSIFALGAAWAQTRSERS